RPQFTPTDGPAGSDERVAGAAPERAAATAASAPTAVASTPTNAGEAHGNPDARMTPAVRRLLREHGLTPAQIVGTGGGGRITREDVTNYVESQRTGQPVGGQAVAASSAAPSSTNGAAPSAPPATPATTPAGPAPAAPAAPAPAAP